MPLTPVTWLDDFVVNLTTAGVQAAPRITQLTDGNILVVWHSADNSGVGSPAGLDIIGQLFDPLGNRVGVEFLVNSSVSNLTELEPDIAALPAGGFLTAFERQEGSLRDILLTVHGADGTIVDTEEILLDVTENAAPAGSHPTVAVSSDTSALVVWEETESATDSRVLGRIYDSSTGTLGPVLSLINFPGTNSNPDVTALINGNYVITAVRDFAGDRQIALRMVSATGGNVLGVTTIAATVGPSTDDRDPSVTSLTEGGFVVAWTNGDGGDTDILAQIYSSTGSAVGTTITVNGAGLTDDNNEPLVVALTDGGFIVVYDNDVAGEIRAQRFDAAGAEVGTAKTIGNGGAAGSIDAKLLGDGRVAVSFQDADGEIRMEIIDVRDLPNDPAVYAPTAYLIGTIGDDTFTADGGSGPIHGHDGNDTITENGAPREYYGGKGNDTLIVTSPVNADLHDGGDGVDTIDWSLATDVKNAFFDLGKGLAIAGDDEVMTGFENLIGTPDADLIIGSDAPNELAGGAGIDTIDGGKGADTMSGGTESDTFFVDRNSDIIVEGAAEGANDSVQAAASFDLLEGVHVEIMSTTNHSGTGVINLYGNTFKQTITGNAGANLISDGGKGAADVLKGLGGNDTYRIYNTGDTIFEGAAEGANDTVLANASFDLLENVFVETLGALDQNSTATLNLYGNTLKQTITGNAGKNLISDGGKGAADVLIGLGGDDSYRVYDSGTEIIEGPSEGALDTVQAAISHTLKAGVHVEALRAIDTAAKSALSLFGNEFGQTITGNAGANVLRGYDGDDTINAGAGDDRVSGGSGNDTLAGNTGADTYYFSNALNGTTNVDTIKGFSSIDLISLNSTIFTKAGPVGALATTAFASNASGAATDALDRIVYETDTGILRYDPDGNGAGLSIAFAIIDNKASMNAGDFVIA